MRMPMKTHLISALALFLSLPAMPQPAAAAPQRVEGRYCNFPHVAKGTWVGFFDGSEEALDIFNMRDSRRSITVWRCFKTKADCTAWKYWMQTDYRAGPQLTWCRKK
jgi:hypothetical protein